MDALWFGKSSDAGSNFIVEVGLRTGDLLGNCLEMLTFVIRNPSCRGHRSLLLQQCNLQIFSECPLFIPGTKVTKCAFPSSPSEGRGLFVYTKPWCILCYLVVRTKHPEAKNRGTCGERFSQGPLAQTSHPAAGGSAAPGAGLAFKKKLYLFILKIF